MPKKTIKVNRLNGPLNYSDEVEFSIDTVVEGDLTAPVVIAIGQLIVTKTLRCEELINPPNRAVQAGKLYVGGEDRGGANDIKAPITVHPDDIPFDRHRAGESSE